MEPKPLSDLLGDLDSLQKARQEWKREVGLTVRSARHAMGLSQADLASLSGVPQPYVSQIENGRRSASSKTLGKLTGALAQTGGTHDDQEHEATARQAARKAAARSRRK